METLIVEREDGVVTVTMNRPERKNAASGVMLNELRDTFEAVERSPEDRVHGAHRGRRRLLLGRRPGGSRRSGDQLRPYPGWCGCGGWVTWPWPSTG